MMMVITPLESRSTQVGATPRCTDNGSLSVPFWKASVVKTTVGISLFTTHLLGDDIRVVMIEDVPLKLGHGLL